MVTRRRFLAMLGSAGVAGVGVAAGVKLLPAEGVADEALPVIRYGEEACARCGMVIDDARFAAAWRAPGPGELHFDDIGCAAKEAADQSLGRDLQAFVHDYNTEEWLDGRKATYVMSAEIRTPMAYGVAAFPSKAAAERVVETHADAHVLGWGGLADHLKGHGL